MAELVKVHDLDEDEKEKSRPQLASANRSKKERAAGYFRERPWAMWVVVAMVVAVLAGGVFAWHYYSVRESTDDAQIDGHIDPISARVSGTVVKVLHDDNEIVQAGTLLVELDPSDNQVSLDRARADLANAEANSTGANVNIPMTATTSSGQLVAADANVKATEREVESAKARVQEAQANYTKVSADLKRMEQLIAKDEISHQQYDAAVAANNSARANLDAALATVASAQSREAQAKAQADAAHTVPEQIKVMRSRAGAATAEVQKFQSAVTQAELNLKYTRIYAPVTGVLSKRNVEPGQVVQAGQPLFSLVNLDDIWCTANFKENQLRTMHPGQRAKIYIDAYGRDYTGTVESIGGATGSRFSILPPENATGNYVKVVQRLPVRIRLDKGQDSDHLLRPGMSAEPTVYRK